MSTMRLLVTALALAALVAATDFDADLDNALKDDDQCAADGEDGVACSLNVLQRKAARTDATITENPQNTTQLLESVQSEQGSWIGLENFCSSQCRAAGYCCNDPSIGMNQMISCSQACMMRAQGSSPDAMLAKNGGVCERNGASGCSLSVNGDQYSFCSSCTDLTRDSKCVHGVVNSDACDYGANSDDTDYRSWIQTVCGKKCWAAGYCCNDSTIGMNQMISCSQACMMRARGSSPDAMLAKNGGVCERNGASGCSLSVNGHQYSFCSRCTDLTSDSKCVHGVVNSDACDYGAMVLETL